MSGVQTVEPSIMSFTDDAANRVQSLISEEGNDNLKLRVFVTGGGCSGFQYGFAFDRKQRCKTTGGPAQLSVPGWFQDRLCRRVRRVSLCGRESNGYSDLWLWFFLFRIDS